MAKDIVSNTGVTYNSLTNGSKIVGKIVADSDFRVDGEVEGEIICLSRLGRLDRFSERWKNQN